MKKKNLINLIITSALFLCFIVFTVLVKVVDVSPIGPDGTSVGFAKMNGAVAEKLGVNLSVYTISDILGLCGMAVALVFATIGVYQLIKNKSIKKVDVDLLVLAGLYVVTILFYAFFEVVIVNYRPVMLDGVLSASYPSSHTMLSVTICASAIIMILNKIRNKKISIPVSCALGLLGVSIIATRLVSGVHWLSDIIGAIILSGALVMAFVCVCSFFKDKQAVHEVVNTPEGENVG